MKKTKPRAKKEATPYLDSYERNKLVLEAFRAIIEDSIQEFEHYEVQKREEEKLRRRYRNDAICFWIGLLLFGVLVADVILLIINYGN